MDIDIEYFWDRSLRLWTILVVDSQTRYQIGDAQYEPSKKYRDETVARLRSIIADGNWPLR